MIRYGSSDAYLFAVQPGSTPYRTGDTFSNRTFDVWVGVGHNTNASGFTNLMSGKQAGNLVLWQYEDTTFSPAIWIVRDSSDNVQYTWEAENKFHPDRDNASPFIDETERRNTLIPSGGSAVEMVFPSLTQLQTIETDAEAVSIPSWVNDTQYADISTAAEILRLTFNRSCERLGLTLLNDVETVVNRNLSLEAKKTYLLLWMREAARLLYNYRGYSVNELIKGYFTVDSNGVPTAI